MEIIKNTVQQMTGTCHCVYELPSNLFSQILFLEFIFKTPSYLGFEPNFQRWIRLFNTDITAEFCLNILVTYFWVSCNIAKLKVIA